MSVHVKVAGAWQEIGVDGSGGGVPWAKVSGGTVTTVTNPDGSVDSVHTFTANGTLTVDSAGYARVLVCGAGQTGSQEAQAGGGGAVRHGVLQLAAGTLAVTVGVTAVGTLVPGGSSSLGTDPYWKAGGGGRPTFGSGITGGTADGTEVSVPGHGATGLRSGTTPGSGVVSDISGTSKEYGKGGLVTGVAPAQSGQGGQGGGGDQPGGSGVVIVRVQTTAPTVSGVVASGGTESTYVGDGVNGVLGQSYKVHKFTTVSAGSLVVTQGGDADVLVVGGGGGSSGGGGVGGGGGGGVVPQSIVLGAGTHPVVVGSAGAAGSPAAAGGHSEFGSLLALGGGFGGGNGSAAGGPGASGGGGQNSSAGGAALYGGAQGFAGIPAGGGGGAGGAPSGGAGGPGIASNLSGAVTTYGAGGSNSGAVAVTPNTGEGGDATLAGSAGVVIVRYEIA